MTPGRRFYPGQLLVPDARRRAADISTKKRFIFRDRLDDNTLDPSTAIELDHGDVGLLISVKPPQDLASLHRELASTLLLIYARGQLGYGWACHWFHVE